jgi:uncharacterized membrane protein (UPF0182 family)
MENNAAARSDLNIWGSNGVKGNLLSLPYGGGMLYIEPIYLKSSGERTYPQLQRVLMNFGGKVAYATTVKEGIAQLLAGAPAPPPNTTPPPGTTTPPPTTTTALAAAAAKVEKAINDLRAAQQSGDFEAQGRALAALDAAMDEFLAAQAAAASPAPTATPTPTG